MGFKWERKEDKKSRIQFRVSFSEALFLGGDCTCTARF